jgi:UDP:flavonoid glycosyltransferase YjiC (YdhE family)
VQVVKAAPHSAVLREAALAITHGGHGVTIKSLALGVPLVCLPMGRDQLDIAARVVHAGAGVRLEHTAAAAEIAAAVEQVLGDASYREAAQRIATTITEETVTDRAVEEIEAVLASTRSRDAVTA